MSKHTAESGLANAEQAIEELQTKLAFQEHTIEELNEALTHQQYQIEKLQVQFKHILDRVKTMEPSNIAKMSEEVPPPHY
ncbi:SlyX family protein [Alteromonas pelagimontana]|uniref:Protein SlyX homolog n=1 Tax=Alteromonas pelagimontana TaxID=1858656 RepID=A0A6M4ME08_9ALTE|nr:SlyX family protein [Alteromonas pelagimontana]QJR80840.1 SlyX family protein [Alteromonas pelagimontana]